MKRTAGRRGFTVLELLVAMTVGIVMVAGAYYIFISQHKGLQQVSNAANSMQMARLTIEQLSRELHMAGFGVVTGETFTEAKKYALTSLGDIDTDISATLAQAAAVGDTQIKVELNDNRDQIERGDYIFINGGGNVEMVRVAQSGETVDFSGEPDTIRLNAGLQHAYPVSATLVRTIESVRYEVVFPGGDLKRNGVLIAEGLADLEFHYFTDDREMTPDAVNGLSQIERAAIRRIEIRVKTSGPTAAASREYSEMVDLRNMGRRPYKLDTCAPNAPSSVLISNTNTCEQFTVTWTSPSANACDGSALTDLGGYKVYYGAASGNYFLPAANVADETLTTFTVEDPRLANNANYYVTMKAYDTSFNESAATSETTFLLQDTTAPHAPADLDASVGSGAVTLTWSKPTDADVKGYRVYRGTVAGFTPSTANRVGDETTLNEEALTFVDSTPQTCVTYYYKVTAVDCANESAASAEAFGNGAAAGADSPRSGVTNTTVPESPASPPEAPSPFVATGRDQAVDLMWTNPSASDFAAVVVRYSTYGYPSSATDGSEVGRYEGPAGQAMTHTVTSLVNGVHYYFSIFAVDRCGNYSARATAHAMPSQSAPVISIIAPADGSTISSGQATFQARAYDPDQAGVSEPPSLTTDDGKGILYVRFWVTPDPGTAQFPRWEFTKTYCGFGGDSSCSVGDVTQWCDGTYQFFATATDDEGQTSSSPYVTVLLHNGGLYYDATVAAAATGTYKNEVTFGIKNDADSTATINTLTLTWNRANARLSRVQLPDGATIWQNASAPANSGDTLTLESGSRPTIASRASASMRLTFVQMWTTLGAAAAAGATQITVQSTGGFAVGDAVYVTDGVNTEAKTVLSVASGTTLGLSSGLSHAYASGSTVRHTQAADDAPMTGADVRVVFGYQKAAISGRTCSSDQIQISLSPSPVLYEAQQDMPATNTSCSTVLAQVQVENYRAVPVHVKVTDSGGSGVANVKVYYVVDSQFVTTAPTSGYTSLTMSYSGTNSRWEATAPYQSSVRVWLYFQTTDNNGQTDRDPTTGAYAYDYYTDTTAPACPLGLLATTIAKKQIDLSWNTNAETDLAGYNIYRKRGTGSFSRVYTRVSDQNASVVGIQYPDNDNNLDTSKYCYTYYVTAVDLQGNESSSCSSFTASAGASPCP